jgi:hypothetical protein
MPILGIMASAISGNLTPTTGYVSIATQTVGAGGVSSVSFTGIPSVYKHLQIRYIARDTTADNDANSAVVRFNSDSGTNYVRHYLLGTGSAVYAGAVQNLTGVDGGLIQGGGGLASCFSAGVIDILDYTNTNKYKTIRSASGNNTNINSALNYFEFESGLWQSTSAITSISVSVNSGNLAQYSSFALYGIQG